MPKVISPYSVEDHRLQCLIVTHDYSYRNVKPTNGHSKSDMIGRPNYKAWTLLTDSRSTVYSFYSVINIVMFDVTC